MDEKYVQEPIITIPEKNQKLLVPPNFDNVTKVEASLNAKVTYN